MKKNPKKWIGQILFLFVVVMLTSQPARGTLASTGSGSMMPMPVLLNVQPNFGPIAGGTTATITGSNLILRNSSTILQIVFFDNSSSSSNNSTLYVCTTVSINFLGSSGINSLRYQGELNFPSERDDEQKSLSSTQMVIQTPMHNMSALQPNHTVQLHARILYMNNTGNTRNISGNNTSTGGHSGNSTGNMGTGSHAGNSSITGNMSTTSNPNIIGSTSNPSIVSSSSHPGNTSSNNNMTGTTGGTSMAHGIGTTIWLSNSSLSFMYKPNPIIFSVQPHTSILAGGTTVTVIGEYFDSVQSPQMISTVIKQGVAQTTSIQASYLSYSTLLKFRTPSVSYPGNTTYYGAGTGLLNNILVDIGFMFDGDYSYYNYGNLSLYLNPYIEQLNPNPFNFIANQDNELSIPIISPPLNYSSDDMSALVSPLGPCVNLTQGLGYLFCVPPPLSTQTIRYGPAPLNTPSVLVFIGNVAVNIGVLTYIDQEPFHVIMIVMIVILFFIVIISLAFGLTTLFFHGKPLTLKTLTNYKKTLASDLLDGAGVGPGHVSTLSYHEIDDNGEVDLGVGGMRRKEEEGMDIIALQQHPHQVGKISDDPAGQPGTSKMV